MAIALGKGTWGACIDAKFAFCNQPMHILQLRLLTFTLNGKIFLNSSLAFRVVSLCYIFEKCALALEWIVLNETGSTWISHFFNDFPLLNKSCKNLKSFMDKFYFIMQDIGMSIAVEKMLGLAQI